MNQNLNPTENCEDPNRIPPEQFTSEESSICGTPSTSSLRSCRPSLVNLRTLHLDTGEGSTSITHTLPGPHSFSASDLCVPSAISNPAISTRSFSLPSTSQTHSIMGASHKKGCAFCGMLNALDGGPLVFCQHCNMVAYCGEEHQKFDWKRHKPLCKTVQSQLARNTSPVTNSTINANPDVRFHLFTPYLPPRTFVSPESPLKVTLGECASTSCSSSPSSSDDSVKCVIQNSIPTSDHLIMPSALLEGSLLSSGKRGGALESRHYERIDADIQILDAKCSTRPQRVQRKRLQHPVEVRAIKDHTYNVPYRTTLQEHLRVFASSGLVFNQHQAVALRLMTIAEHVIRGLTEYGWAMVDNFLGVTHCRHSYQETENLYDRGLFSAGQLMTNKFGSHSQDVRSDEIYWFEGGDERARDAVTIRLLVSMIDSIVVRFSGRFPYKISGRSRPMIAVYPGNGTRYVKHVDNPVKDGRCVTSIYYSNENWNTNQDGGVMRLYPESSSCPVDIEPLADRLVFFWSDRRNPHEVMPCFKNRFAITIWYFDANEKMAALEKKREEEQRTKSFVPLGLSIDGDKGLMTRHCDTEMTLPQQQPSPTGFKPPNASSLFSGEFKSAFSTGIIHGFDHPNAFKVVMPDQSRSLDATGCKARCTLPVVILKHTPPA